MVKIELKITPKCWAIPFAIRLKTPSGKVVVQFLCIRAVI
jgi:hypothetical protein